MNDCKQNHHKHEKPDGNTEPKMQHPYWKRAHRDWRTWVAVVIMLAGMITYVMTEDFSLRFRGRPPATLEK
jgi:hypothetical protein